MYTDKFLQKEEYENFFDKSLHCNENLHGNKSQKES